VAAVLGPGVSAGRVGEHQKRAAGRPPDSGMSRMGVRSAVGGWIRNGRSWFDRYSLCGHYVQSPSNRPAAPPKPVARTAASAGRNSQVPRAREGARDLNW